MNDNVLNIVNKTGQDILPKLLMKPFYTTVEPAFSERASEIIIKTTIANKGKEGQQVSAHYKKEGYMHVLTIDKEYQPWEVSWRLKIAAHISIALTEDEKRGEMRIRFGKELVDVKVQTILKDNLETVTLTPDWKTVGNQ